MTRKESIDHLKNMLGINGFFGDAEKEALKIAIAALSAVPREDAISRGVFEQVMWKRDVAIDQLKELGYGFGEKPRTGWIPITYRPATDEEKKHYAERTGYDEEDIDTILNCQLPEDGETVLITDSLGNVEVDTFINDCDGCYFECNCDMEDVRAWMPLPKRYDPQESEEQS